MLQSKVLNSNDIVGLSEYRKKVLKVLKLELPMEYLQRSKVRIFTKEDKLVGGYLITKKGPYRSFEGIPVPFTLPDTYKESQICEVNGLFLLKEQKKGLETVKLWLRLIGDLVSDRSKKYMVFSYDYNCKKLAKIYSIVGANIVYKGKIKPVKGMKYDNAYEAVEIVKISQIFLRALMNWYIFILVGFSKGNRKYYDRIKPAKKTYLSNS